MALSDRIVAALAVGLALLALIGYAGYQSINRLVADGRTVARTHEVNAAIERMLSRVKDAETTSQGFVITGDERYLEPYDTAQAELPRDISALRTLFMDSLQRQRLDTIEALISRDLGLLAEQNAARRTGGFAGARAFVATGVVKATTDLIRARVGEVQARSASLLLTRQQRSIHSTRIAIGIILGGFALALILGLTALLTIRRAIEGRDRAMFDREQFFRLSWDLLGVAGRDGHFSDVNGSWERALGYTPEAIKAQPFINLVHPEDREKTRIEFHRLLAGAPSTLFENRYRHRDGGYRSLLWSATLDAERGLVYASGKDVTELKKAQAELQQLSGLLPICASCKKIRDDKGRWTQLEVYITHRSAAEFSHSICPDCQEKFDENAAS